MAQVRLQSDDPIGWAVGQGPAITVTACIFINLSNYECWPEVFRPLTTSHRIVILVQLTPSLLSSRQYFFYSTCNSHRQQNG